MCLLQFLKTYGLLEVQPTTSLYNHFPYLYHQAPWHQTPSWAKLAFLSLFSTVLRPLTSLVVSMLRQIILLTLRTLRSLNPMFSTTFVLTLS